MMRNIVCDSLFSDLTMNEVVEINGGKINFEQACEMIIIGACTTVGAGLGAAGGIPGAIVGGAIGCIVGCVICNVVLMD